MFITDFSWVVQPKDDWFFGMYTSNKSGLPPANFEPFQFHIVTAPDAEFDIFHIPVDVMYKAGLSAGFKSIEFQLQYANPEYKSNPVVRRYLDECDPSDYVMKFKF